ncbi:DUF3857 domain-containing protein [Arsenicibacter rosenii]|uniref:Uncharacterized protein n=1 Tax=Arsenicibacter rosenii TaxID=1750698 RepID=A0A1S2VL82_9BACT|nr:DUF3857 domain-containing protein [Arsenicibacter rosenii]OIN58985.1 hypothetical protein BLX24_12270 [Arsenicibacter rosenii]
MSVNFIKPHRFVVAFLCCFLWAGISRSQNDNSKVTEPNVRFGKIDPAGFSQKSALHDSTAEAVVLYERGDVHFSMAGNDIQIVLEYQTRIKILRKAGYDRATVEIPLLKAKSGPAEFVSNIEGFTYNESGGTIQTDKLTKEGIFTEKVSGELSIQKFTLPDVREGSVIEYRYRLTTPFSVNHNPRTWKFQQRIPVAWSEYRINVHDYFYYKMIMGGYLRLAINENQPGTQSYRFVVQNAPAFRDEAFITTPNDYISKIDFELASYSIPGAFPHKISVSWPDMDKTLLAENIFSGQLNGQHSFLKDAARAIIKTNPDTLSRLQAACRFINSQVVWDKSNSFYSYNIRKAFEDRKGDAGDINLMLIALLRQMDLPANPVILSTRSHGHIMEEYALLRQFNYVVAHVMVNGKDMLLDATDPFLKTGMLPFECLNGHGRLVVGRDSRFLPIIPAERETEVAGGTFTISAEGDVKGVLKKTNNGYSGLKHRRQYVVDGEAGYLENIRRNRPAWQITSVEFNNVKEVEKGFEANYTLEIPEACQRAGDRMYIKPMLTEARFSNPFKEPERLFPVDMGVPMEETYFSTFTLPAGYEVEEAPKPMVMSLPENEGRFTYQVTVEGNRFTVTSRMLLRKARFYAEQYHVLREFFDKVVAKQAEQVVIKRTGPVAEKK